MTQTFPTSRFTAHSTARRFRTMPGTPPVEYDPTTSRANAIREDGHHVYLVLQPGEAEALHLFTEAEIGDPDILNDKRVIDYFERLLTDLGWLTTRDHTNPARDGEIADWSLAPGASATPPPAAADAAPRR